jgi:hypothetical protein
MDLNRSSEDDVEPITIQTSKGRRIPCKSRGWVMTQEELERSRREFERYHKPYLVPLEYTERRGPTYDYNCHGLTFLSRRAWMDESTPVDPFRLLFADDDYEGIPVERILPGDIAVYYKREKGSLLVGGRREEVRGSIQHTGIVVQIDRGTNPPRIWILSKWSDLGEYLHTLDNCPYAGSVVFMREGMHGSPESGS